MPLTHLVQACPAAGAHVQTDLEEGRGRQVDFHVSPRPGQTPTSRPAFGNYRPPHFQPEPPSSHTVLRTWGSGSPNFSSVLLMQCLLSLPLSLGHTHTHTTVEMNLPKESPKNCAKPRDRTVHNERQLTLQVMHFNGFLGNACIRQWKKKNPQTDSSSQAAQDPDSSACGSAAQRLQPAQKPAARGRLRRREKEPGRLHVPLR